MKLYRKIDTTTGDFIEDVLFENHPTLEDGELDPQYIEEAPAQGFYLPRWNGTEWVEDGQAPEPKTPQLSTDEKLTQMAEQLVITQANVAAAQEALDFLFWSVPEETIRKKINWVKKGDKEGMQNYFASRIKSGKLDYLSVVTRYPQFKDGIDEILINDGFQDLIV